MAKRLSAKAVVQAQRPTAELVKTPVGNGYVFQIVDRGLNISGNQTSAGAAWAAARHALPCQPQPTGPVGICFITDADGVRRPLSRTFLCF